jgi:predicted RNA-binding Zn-ribbon protein involved in translation (DUF1610 family)
MYASLRFEYTASLPSRCYNPIAKMPPVMRRGMYWFLCGTLVFVAIAVAIEVTRDVMGVRKTRWLTLLTVAVGWVPLLVLLPIWRWRTLGIRRLVRSSDYRVCIHCGYDLASLSENGTCPECGRPYEMEAVRDVWKRSGFAVPPPQVRNQQWYDRGL